jgi:hypothetical protein
VRSWCTKSSSITCLKPRILFKVDALGVLTKLEPLRLMLKVGASQMHSNNPCIILWEPKPKVTFYSLQKIKQNKKIVFEFWRFYKMHYAITSNQQITRMCLFMIITNFKMPNNFARIEIKTKMWNILQMIHTLKLLCIIIISIFMLKHKSKANLRHSRLNAHLKHSQFTLHNYSPLFTFMSCCAQQILCKWL